MAEDKRGVFLERAVIEELIFGRRQGGPGGEGEPRRYRFTQDSPVLPDVWIRYGEYPRQPQDLLLTPRFGVTAGEVSRQVRADCKRERDEIGQEERVDVAYNQTYVVARLYFDELIRVILPMTRWWQHNVSRAARVLTGISEADGSFGLGGLEDAAVQEQLAGDLAFLDRRGIADPERAARVRDLADLLWMMRIVGSIAWARSAKRHNKQKAPPSGRQIMRAITGLVKDMQFDADAGDKLLWQVNLNRPAGTAIERSTLAVKADAARLLFEVRCGEVAWAVVDNGIDASHPAFWDWNGDLGDVTRALKAAAPSREERKGWNRRSVKEYLRDLAAKEVLAPEDLARWPALTRVKATYDFTRARRLFNAGSLFDGEQMVAEADWPAFVRRNIRRAELDHKLDDDNGEERAKREADKLRDRFRELARRLYDGRGIDWALAQPFLEVPHDDAEYDLDAAAAAGADRRFYERPSGEHGTHVAGILGADWPQQGVKGMCPDIGLYDMRVIDPGNANSDEFAVLSALQFIGFLNDQKDLFAVHGVNMSLSIRHDVANFACGRTPACDECERLVSSGVVVVAAAGNQGYLRYSTPEGDVDGYHTVSITDPGNAESVITVGATHRFQPHTYGVSYFSSRGPTGDGRLKPDLVAPGEKIEAPVPRGGSRSKDGTSMAAPHVSGAAAMLLARHTELVGQPERIKRALTDTATDLGRERYFQGHGMLDVLRALQSI